MSPFLRENLRVLPSLARQKGTRLQTANTDISTPYLVTGAEPPCASSPTRPFPNHVAIVTTAHDGLLNETDRLKENAFEKQLACRTITRKSSARSRSNVNWEGRPRDKCETSDTQEESSFKTRAGCRRMRRQPGSPKNVNNSGALLVSDNSKELVRLPRRRRERGAIGDGGSHYSTRKSVLVYGRGGSTERVCSPTITSSVSLTTLKLQETSDQNLSSTSPGKGDELDR